MIGQSPRVRKTSVCVLSRSGVLLNPRNSRVNATRELPLCLEEDYCGKCMAEYTPGHSARETPRTRFVDFIVACLISGMLDYLSGFDVLLLQKPRVPYAAYNSRCGFTLKRLDLGAACYNIPIRCFHELEVGTVFAFPDQGLTSVSRPSFTLVMAENPARKVTLHRIDLDVLEHLA